MNNSIKNQSPFVITIALLAVITIVMLIPTDNLLNKVFADDFKSEWVGIAFKMGLLFVIGYGLIKRFKIHALSGLSSQFPWRYKYLNLIPIYLIIIGILGISARDFSLIQPANILLLLFACLIVGFAEEYLFRGLLQSLFLKKYGLRKNGIFMSILLTAVFFGVFHLLNLTKNDNTSQVLIQVVYALFIGFFFGVLVLKTNKLIPLAITHGLINFFFSLAFLPGLKPAQDLVEDTTSIAPIILTLPLFIIGLFIYRKLDKKELLEKMEIEQS